MGATERKPQTSRNSFACFSAVLSQQALSTEVMMFLLPHADEIKGLIAGQIGMKNEYYLILNNILDEVIVHIEQRFKTNGWVQICWLVKSKAFFTHTKKNSDGSIFQFWMYIKTYWIWTDWNESVYATDFIKQVSSKQEVRDYTGTWTKPSFGRSSQIIVWFWPYLLHLPPVRDHHLLHESM